MKARNKRNKPLRIIYIILLIIIGFFTLNIAVALILSLIKLVITGFSLVALGEVIGFGVIAYLLFLGIKHLLKKVRKA